jgi:ABC-type multidrug transport system ATPase subunit
MRRRLDLAASLVGRPQLLFLDEPTTGLDPRARIEVWDMVRTLLATGVTVLLTTQYLEEADQLADEIVVVDHGSAPRCQQYDRERGGLRPGRAAGGGTAPRRRTHQRR